jgi:hypothetical protein
MIKPHPTFETIRADEVAECWAGVSSELYGRLWNDIVPHQKPIPNLEDSGPGDHVGHENLAHHWDKLSPEDQATLNCLAEQEEAEFKEWLAQAERRWADCP